jgi:hypothetical protein
MPYTESALQVLFTPTTAFRVIPRSIHTDGNACVCLCECRVAYNDLYNDGAGFSIMASCLPTASGAVLSGSLPTFFPRRVERETR